MLKLHRWFVGLRGLTNRPPWGRSIKNLPEGDFWVSCPGKCFTMKFTSEHRDDALRRLGDSADTEVEIK